MDQEKELERLREAMENAKALYESAKLEYEKATQLRSDLGSTNPDGSLRHATRVRAHAYRNYRDALMEFNRCVLDRKAPIG
jgi:hypothetical protein